MLEVETMPTSHLYHRVSVFMYVCGIHLYADNGYSPSHRPSWVWQVWHKHGQMVESAMQTVCHLPNPSYI